MKQFVFTQDDETCWIVTAQDEHNAIALAVENGFSESMHDFYYGLSDGQINVLQVNKEISSPTQNV